MKITMENQLYIPNNVLSRVTKENAELINYHVALLNRSIPEIYSRKEIKTSKSEHMMYMLMILEKMIFGNPDGIGELTKIQILKKDLQAKIEEDLEGETPGGTPGVYRSDLLYPTTPPTTNDQDVTALLQATLYSSPDPIDFKPIKDLQLPASCIVYKMYTNSDFYYYQPNKGFVGTTVAERAVTEELIQRTQYINKVVVKEDPGRIEGITVEVLGTSPVEVIGGSSPGEASSQPIVFILNDELFSLHRKNPDMEVLTSRYNIFKILPKEMEFSTGKLRNNPEPPVLGDIFAQKKLEELFFKVLIEKENKHVKISITNALTEIFLQKLNRITELKREAASKVWNRQFFYEKRHIYMLYLERILGVLENSRGVNDENTIKYIVNMIINDDTSRYSSILAELKKWNFLHVNVRFRN